jgi:CheY-like chemotaxis protein
MAREHQPDLISLDLSMPGKDGVDTFVELRKTAETQEIPVCVVTGHPEFRQVIYDRPVTPPEGYLGKPVDEDKLVAYAHHIIEHREEKAN